MSTRHKVFALVLLVLIAIGIALINRAPQPAPQPTPQARFSNRSIHGLDIGEVMQLAFSTLADPSDVDQLLASKEVLLSNDYVIATIGNGEKYLVETSGSDAIKDIIRRGEGWDRSQIRCAEQFITVGSNVVDVGAHIGTVTIPYAQFVGDSGRVYAFEPQQKIYAELLSNLYLNKINNVTAIRKAVGNSFGEIEMAVPPRNNEGGTGFGKNGELVPLIPLDSLRLKDISFIKIDVEGAEKMVLEGARQTITREKPVIYIEILGEFSQSPNDNKHFDDTVQLLKDLDYSVTRASSPFRFKPRPTSSDLTPTNYGADYLALPRSYNKQFEQDRCEAIADQ